MYWNYPYGAISAQQSQIADTRQPRTYSEDLLERNTGKRISAYMTYDASNQWRDKIFTGTLRQIGRDFFLIRDQKTGKDTMLLNINIAFIIFEDQPATLSETSHE